MIISQLFDFFTLNHYIFQAMAGGNLAGRLGWAAVSDKIGRKATFNCFTFGSVPIFAALPFCIEQVVMNPTGAMAPVYLGKVSH